MEFLLRSILAISQGALITLVVTFVSILVGFIVGVPLAIGRTYGNRVLQVCIQAYEGFFRGTPLVVVLFIFYFGLRHLGELFGNPDFRVALPPFAAAVLSLGLTSSAYQSMIFRGAIQSISKDQYDAARSLGMGKWKAILRIVFVQAFRVSMPGFTNEFTIVLKDSPITYMVAIPEMLTQARGIIDYAGGKVFFEVLLPVAGLYFVFFVLANKVFGRIEERLRIPGFELSGRT